MRAKRYNIAPIRVNLLSNTNYINFISAIKVLHLHLQSLTLFYIIIANYLTYLSVNHCLQVPCTHVPIPLSLFLSLYLSLSVSLSLSASPSPTHCLSENLCSQRRSEARKSLEQSEFTNRQPTVINVNLRS